MSSILELYPSKDVLEQPEERLELAVHNRALLGCAQLHEAAHESVSENVE